MTGIDREALSRFLDGESTGSERRAIAGDQTAMDEAGRMRQQDDALRAWFDGLADEPPPPALERTIRGGFKARRARHSLSRWWPSVAAAAVVFVAGLAAFDAMIDRRVNQALDRMRAERASDIALLASAVQDVLEKQPSGSEVRFENASTGFGVTLVPQRTWKSASGHWCREFVEVFDSAEPNTAPVSTACRTTDGRWVRVRTEVQAPETPFLPVRGRNL